MLSPDTPVAATLDCDLFEGFQPMNTRPDWKVMFKPHALADSGTIPERQLIPYVILHRTKSPLEYFTYQKNHTHDPRLQTRRSLGFCMHLTQPQLDASVESHILSYLLEQRLNLVLPNAMDLNLEFRGLIVDSTTSLSRNHIGLVYLLQIPTRARLMLRLDSAGQFLTLTKLRQERNQFEPWAQNLLYTFLT